MLRKLFIDFVIVFALCLVVWGIAPALVAKDLTKPQPPYYEPKDLSSLGNVSTGKINHGCCKDKGESGTADRPCKEHVHAVTRICLPDQKVCDTYTRYRFGYPIAITITCKCTTYARLQGTGALSGNYLVSCECVPSS